MQIKMKAAVLKGIGDLEIEDIDIPSCNHADILIKVESCAICKTDVKMFHAGHRDLKLPRVLGHEVAGTIVEVGKEVAEKNHLADVIIDSCDIGSDPVEVIREETNSSGVDVVIPAGSAPEVPVQGIKMLNKRGRIIFSSGLPYGHENVPLDHNQIHYKEIQIFGAYGCTSEQNREAVRMLSTGRLNVKYLITHRISLDELIIGFEMVDMHNAMEVVVK